jgi:glucose-6-phosphate isomerase
MGVLMKINTYNQPGVEIGKKIFSQKFSGDEK